MEGTNKHAGWAFNWGDTPRLRKGLQVEVKYFDGRVEKGFPSEFQWNPLKPDPIEYYRVLEQAA